MRRCPKCSLTFDDSARICRSCGAILEHLSDESAATVGAPSKIVDKEADEDVNEEIVDSELDWTCPICGESVPDTFALCWKCSCKRPEDADSNSQFEPGPEPDQPAAPIHSTCCAACGSTKIVPNAKILDQGKNSSGSLCVVVMGDPDAIIFKDRVYGTLTADFCGDCGHVNICVNNPGELYGHYLRSQRRRT